MILYTILIGAAAHRLWRMFAMDTLTVRPRMWLMQRDGWAFDKLNYLMHCAWCIGFWYCLGLSIAVAQVENWSLLTTVLVTLAASTLCGFLGKIDQLLSE